MAITKVFPGFPSSTEMFILFDFLFRADSFCVGMILIARL